MIRVLLLDLGETLVDAADRPFPGVPEALAAVRKFKAANGKPLLCCLVSDFTMPHPRTAKAIDAAFKEYVKILDGVGLTRFFKPVGRRVTLSTHAGVFKPDRRVFETALRRARSGAGLSECLFITENKAHVKACRKLGMDALQFGKDFKNWADAPPLIAGRIGQ
jgi:FMN phosphatase YigB (HAD superfamily)